MSHVVHITTHSKLKWISNINLYFMYGIKSNQIHILWNRNLICLIFVHMLPGIQSVHRYRTYSSKLVSLLYSWFNIMPSAQINVTNNFSSYIYTNWMIIQFKLTVLNWISYNTEENCVIHEKIIWISPFLFGQRKHILYLTWSSFELQRYKIYLFRQNLNKIIRLFSVVRCLNETLQINMATYGRYICMLSEKTFAHNNTCK